jgi:hypothetical protein
LTRKSDDYREVQLIVNELGRANDEASKLLSNINRIRYEVLGLVAVFKANPVLALAYAAAMGGVEVYTGIMAYYESIEERQKQTERIIRRIEGDK